MENETATRNCWAPELFWDAKERRFLIFWASTVTNRFLATAGQSESAYNHRMFFTTTRDFTAFEPARVFYDPGFSVIDATLVPFRSEFLMVIKDERVNPVKKHLFVASAGRPEGPYGKPGAPFTPDWVEGPTILRVGEEFVAYFDRYRDHRYGAMKTRDFKTWEDVSDRLVVPKGIRHGTAFPVSEKVLEKLMATRP
jgi:hypothetical protein